VREEVKIEEGQILEIAEFLHPRVQEIADTLPEKWGQWLLDSGWPRRLLERFTHKGRVLKTSTIRGFLTLYIVAALKPTRPRSLRFKTEQALIENWLATIASTAPRDYALAAEIAMCRTLVKGYSDTHERGRKNFETLMALLPDLNGPDAAAKLASLRKAALADDTGAALSAAVKQVRPLSQAAE
jgi:indolepyruvate ferredoxin oxidoreductase beta subunit